MASLARCCNAVIEGFYEVSSLSDAVVLYGRSPDGKSLSDIISQIGSSWPGANEDIVSLLTDMWSDLRCYDNQYGEDPWFIEKTKFAEVLSEEWRQMEKSLLHEARYINPVAAKMLETVFGPVLNDRTNDGNAVVVEVGEGKDIDTLYRARVFQTADAMEKALGHPERHLGPPSPSIAAAGRMNAKGVSVFYGATHKDIAISEVRPPVGSHVVVGAFKVIRPLRLLDLHHLGSITLKPDSSVYDPTTALEASRRDFLGTLSQRMIMPIMPELQEQDYLTTQAIADFLATHANLNLDGILFRSSQNSKTSKSTTGRNAILFKKASMVLRSEERFGVGTTVDLWYYDESCPKRTLRPEIWTTPHKEDDQNALTLREVEPAEPALELDRNSLEIYEIEGVRYEKTAYQVDHHVSRTKAAVN